MFKKDEIIEGKYKVLSLLGKGGMSNVYQVINIKTLEQYAVKEVRRDVSKNVSTVKQSLIGEADMLKKLNHPNLPNIIDIIEKDDFFLIVMDYIEGETLEKKLKREGAQPEKQVVEWAKQICGVLDYLHSRNPSIIYRDMKPSNVMLKPDGTIFVIDFGTAREYKEQKLSDTVCLGTQGYAAPEQYDEDKQTDARTDIYCLGATIFQLLTNVMPYDIKPIRDVNSSISKELEAIILKCMQTNPDDRFQSCNELEFALSHIDESNEEYYRLQRKKLNIFLGSIIVMLLFLIIALFGGISNYQILSNLGISLSMMSAIVSVILFFSFKIGQSFKYLEGNDKQEFIIQQKNNGVAISTQQSITPENNTRDMQTNVIGSYDLTTAYMESTSPLEAVKIEIGNFEIVHEQMLINTDIIL